MAGVQQHNGGGYNSMFPSHGLQILSSMIHLLGTYPLERVPPHYRPRLTVLRCVFPGVLPLKTIPCLHALRHSVHELGALLHGRRIRGLVALHVCQYVIDFSDTHNLILLSPQAASWY